MKRAVFGGVNTVHLDNTFVNQVLDEFYNHSDRFYHGVNHIVKLFALAKKMKLNLTAAQELALVFHDAIYVPGSDQGVNEDQSARLMVSLVGQQYANGERPIVTDARNWNTILVEAVAIIRDTATHKPSDELSNLVLDLDLSGFADLKQLNKDSELVYQEYAGVLAAYGDTARSVFDVGRLNFMKEFLQSHPRIYHSPEFAHLEGQARMNLQTVIKGLQSKLGLGREAA